MGCYAAAVNDAVTSSEDSSKNEEDGEETLTIHPLLIEHVNHFLTLLCFVLCFHFELCDLFCHFVWQVIKEILSFFPRSYAKNSDMLVFRQVCKDWRDVITNGMKYKGITPHVQFSGDPKDFSFHKFHLDMILSENLPFDRFTFNVNFFVKSNFEDWNEFLKLWSPSITGLVIKVGKQYSMPFGDLDFEQFDFVNLKSMSFECSHLITNLGEVKLEEESNITKRTSVTWQPTHPEENARRLVSLFSGILASANQLEKLELYLPARYFEGESGPSYNSKFGEVLIDNLPESVIKLKVTMQLSDEQLSRLAGKKYLKIKQLDLEYYGSQTSGKSLEEWIESQKESLKELRLVDFDGKHDNQLNLSACGKISVLTVKGNCFSFSTLNRYPKKLEKLVIITPPLNDTLKHPTAAPAISELDLSYPLCNPKWISDIPMHLANLQCLKIQVGVDSNVAIQSVFQNLGTTLVQLEISFLETLIKTSVDPLITGLPFPACMMAIEANYNVVVQREILQQLGDGGIKKPSIDNLSRLKKVKVTTGNEISGWVILTDVSVHYGFFRCRALEEIEFVGKHSVSSLQEFF